MVKSISPVRYESVFIVIDGIVFLLLLAPIIIIAVTTNRINESSTDHKMSKDAGKKKSTDSCGVLTVLVISLP